MYASNHSQLKLTMHASSHPQLKLTMHASNLSQLKLTMHTRNHSQVKTYHACKQPPTTETHHACSHSQLKLAMHASNHPQQTHHACKQPPTTETLHACNLISRSPCNTQTQILNLELTGGQGPLPPTPTTPLRTKEESCCLSYHLSTFWPKVSHCSTTNLRVGGCRINETKTKRGKAP